MIKYPVTVNEVIVNSGGHTEWQLLHDDDCEVLARIFDKDVAYSIANALNAMHGFPSFSENRLEGEIDALIIDWYRKFIDTNY